MSMIHLLRNIFIFHICDSSAHYNGKQKLSSNKNEKRKAKPKEFTLLTSVVSTILSILEI